MREIERFLKFKLLTLNTQMLMEADIMPKGKLTRLEGLREAILEILSEHDHPTTNKIQKLVQDRGINASWITTKNYLEELEQEGQVTRTILGDEFKMSAWGIVR